MRERIRDMLLDFHANRVFRYFGGEVSLLVDEDDNFCGFRYRTNQPGQVDHTIITQRVSHFWKAYRWIWMHRSCFMRTRKVF